MRTNRLVIYVLLLLIIAVLFQFGSGNNLTSSNLASGLDTLTSIAAIGGLFGLLYQFKRDKDLAEANFVVQLNQSFITNKDIKRIYTILEASKENGQNDNPFEESDLIDMANYISFFGPFWGLVDRGVMKVNMIDVMAYRFFLGTNNRFMQEVLLCKPGKEKAWRNIYFLHKTWLAYRNRKNLPVWQDEYDLSKTSAYSKVINDKS